MSPPQSSSGFAGESRFDSPITVVVEEADALDVLLELNAAPGIEAAFAERGSAYDEAKEHPLYSLDVPTVVELVIALSSSLTTLATALIAYRSKKLAQGREQGQQEAGVVIVINGQQLQIAVADTPASVKEKLQVRLETSQPDTS